MSACGRAIMRRMDARVGCAGRPMGEMCVRGGALRRDQDEGHGVRLKNFFEISSAHAQVLDNLCQRDIQVHVVVSRRARSRIGVSIMAKKAKKKGKKKAKKTAKR